MSSQLESPDYIPFDPPISEKVRLQIIDQIKAERPVHYQAHLHPLVDDAELPKFPSSILPMIEKIEKGEDAEKSIDITRYEADALEPPPRTLPTSHEQHPQILAGWRNTLSRAYASSTYLSGRNTNLALLETYGKNAWLIANWNADAKLKHMEAELSQLKSDTDNLNAERRLKQEAAKAEIDVLDLTWKKSMRGIVEVQLATENLKSQVKN